MGKKGQTSFVDDYISMTIANKDREIAELKDKLADQRVLKAEILRAGQENKRLESCLELAEAYIVQGLDNAG